MPRLDTLPPELLFHILSYTDPPYCLSLTTYPLNALAATNRHLHAIVEEYARNLLQRHAGGVEVPKNARVSSCRRKWLGELCWFCKRKSRRKACFGRGMTCCLGCDRKEFAKMVSLSFFFPPLSSGNGFMGFGGWGRWGICAGVAVQKKRAGFRR